MKLQKAGILALSLTGTATAGLAADYEIFADTATVETGVNHYAVERLDHENKKLHHCTTVLDAKTRQLTVECTEIPGFPESPAGKGSNVQGAMQTDLADCQCSALGKSIRQQEKLNSVFQTLPSAWR